MASLTDAASEKEYESIHALLQRGDIVGVTGKRFYFDL